MKIVVNVSSLLGDLNGIGFYTLHLLEQMLAESRYADIQGIGGRRWFDRQQLRVLVTTLQTPGQREPSSGAQRLINARRALMRKLPGADQALRHWMDSMCRKRRKQLHGYLYWEPSYLLLSHLRPAITTIHDMSHTAFPQFHPADRVRQFERNLADSISQSRHIITVSKFSRDQISQHFDIEPSQISIVSPAVADTYRSQYDSAALNAVAKRYGLPENFILTVGTLEPRKNLEGLMLAHEQLDQELRSRYPLVVVGSYGWKFDCGERRMHQMINKGQLLRLGFVPERDLPSLYKLATLLAFPSFYEGFGMPVAEAMAAGLPVLTSDRAAMPETAAGAAELMDPDSVESIQSGLTRLLQDADYRDELSSRGSRAAATYTWQASAAALGTLFESFGATPDLPNYGI